MRVYVDIDQVTAVEISTAGADGSEVSGSVFVLPVLIPLEDVGSWLAAYDASSSTSPSAADGRKIARAVLDALEASV